MNLSMPGNPRYQPRVLVDFFGYDNLYRTVAEVELAVLRVFADIGLLSEEVMSQITPEIRDQLLSIKTTEVDRLKREVTKHDIRAWIQLARQHLPEEVARFLHLTLTSYDALETGRALQYVRAHETAIKPAVRQVVGDFRALIEAHADDLQIGRTHGQHALPITVGFWLASIAQRVMYNARMMDDLAKQLVGKISGAVGCQNAQVAFGIAERCGTQTFEQRVLEKLDLPPSPVSTQILPPEPLGYYLHSCMMLSAAFGQFGRDCRHLMRPEIDEVYFVRDAGAVGSSTMAGKINPADLESLEGMWWRTLKEYVGSAFTLISEHQRDLVSSASMRDFPIVVINLMNQLSTLTRKNKDGDTMLSRMRVKRNACENNFRMNAHLMMGEPVYIALQLVGYTGDAHALVNDVLAPRSRSTRRMLIVELGEEAYRQGAEPALREAYDRIPKETKELLGKPEAYTGDARRQALDAASSITAFLDSY